MNGWADEVPAQNTCVIHTTREELSANLDKAKTLLGKIERLNIVLTDIEAFKDNDIVGYKDTLDSLAERIVDLYKNGKKAQTNLLTDRLLLKGMNNCGAGDTNITLAPDGNFYVCPAFYYDKESVCLGGSKKGLNMRNKQLYRLDHAPICSHCDAWQCKRCVWLNRKLTCEVNTPSHEQCVLAHIERNVSRDLLNAMRQHDVFLPEVQDIEEIDYLDPFDNNDKWQ